MTNAAPPPIVVRGARTHNLVDVELRLPSQGMVVFVGVSGSGKSSLAMDTLWVEGQRRFLRAQGGSRLARPDFDLLTGLPPTIGMHQRGRDLPGRRTLAELAEVAEPLAAVWAWAGEVRCPHCARPLPVATPTVAARRLLDERAGARATFLAPLQRPSGVSPQALLEEARELGFARVRLDGQLHHLDEVPPDVLRKARGIEVVVDRLRLEPERQERIAEACQVAFAAGGGRIIVAFEEEGLPQEAHFADRPWCPDHPGPWEAPHPHSFRADTTGGACSDCRGSGIRAGDVCPTCQGERLGRTGRNTYVGEERLPPLLSLPIDAACATLRRIKSTADAAIVPLLDDVLDRLSCLAKLGLGALSLDRRSRSMSTGERHRLALAAATSPALPGVLYRLDEPCAGLGPRDAALVRGHLQGLVEGGARLLVVDHDLDLLALADHIVEFGPGAGRAGGSVVFQGTLASLQATDTPTARALRGPPAISPAAPPQRAELRLTTTPVRGGPSLTVALPMPGLSAIVGPSGSGKSNLLERTLGRALHVQLTGGGPPPLPYKDAAGFDRVLRLVRLSRAPLGASARSCTATAAGIWSPLRAALAQTREARMRGFGPARFSFNRPGGRCPTCRGAGRKRVALDDGPAIDAICPLCEGRRFEPDTLSVRLKGLSVADLLDATVSEALVHFQAWPQVRAPLRALDRAGLGYLVLGQATDTLSGGEAQRLRLARELARLQVVTTPDALFGTVLLLDEPALGLHPMDADQLAVVFVDLVEGGATIVCATASARIAAAADHVVVLD
jgi:excinuclease ABC subunit A